MGTLTLVGQPTLTVTLNSIDWAITSAVSVGAVGGGIADRPEITELNFTTDIGPSTVELQRALLSGRAFTRGNLKLRDYNSGTDYAEFEFDGAFITKVKSKQVGEQQTGTVGVAFVPLRTPDTFPTYTVITPFSSPSFDATLQIGSGRTEAIDEFSEGAGVEVRVGGTGVPGAGRPRVDPFTLRKVTDSNSRLLRTSAATGSVLNNVVIAVPPIGSQLARRFVLDRAIVSKWALDGTGVNIEEVEIQPIGKVTTQVTDSSGRSTQSCYDYVRAVDC